MTLYRVERAVMRERGISEGQGHGRHNFCESMGGVLRMRESLIGHRSLYDVRADFLVF